jgi:hypothetical protein
LNYLLDPNLTFHERKSFCTGNKVLCRAKTFEKIVGDVEIPKLVLNVTLSCPLAPIGGNQFLMLRPLMPMNKILQPESHYKRSSSTQLTPPPAARPKLTTIWEFAETDATNIVNGVTSLKFEIKSDQPMGIVVVSETVRHDEERVFPETGRSSFGFVGVIKSASARVYDGKIKIDLCLCGWDSKAGRD